MREKLIAIMVMTVALLLWSGGIAGAVQDEWQYFKELPAGSQGFALIKLDAETMQNCQENFADIRLTDQSGKEIPCQVIEPGQEQTIQSLNIVNSFDYGDLTVVVFDIGENPHPHNQLTLNVTGNGDYLREVEIKGSNDANNWSNIGMGRIYSYQSEHYSQINYPTSTMRFLQVSIKKQPGDSNLQVNSASLRFLSSNIYEGKPLSASIISNHSNQNTTELVVDLGVPNYMITSLQIQSLNRNYNRNIMVSSNDKAEFTGEKRTQVSGRIMAYDFNNYVLNQDSLSVEQFCRRYLLISIQNEDSPPLDIQAIQVYGASPIFIAELAAHSILWYGNPRATLPSYDLKEYANLIAKTDLPVVETGGQKMNPDYKAPIVPWTEKNKWLLDAAIVLTAIGFASIIFKKLKQLESPGEED